jgi:hypothetical protein
MRGAIRRYADEVWRTDGVTVKIRVGLNSGEVVVGAIGRRRRRKGHSAEAWTSGRSRGRGGREPQMESDYGRHLREVTLSAADGVRTSWQQADRRRNHRHGGV